MHAAESHWTAIDDCPEAPPGGFDWMATVGQTEVQRWTDMQLVSLI